MQHMPYTHVNRVRGERKREGEERGCDQHRNDKDLAGNDWIEQGRIIDSFKCQAQQLPEDTCLFELCTLMSVVIDIHFVGC